MSRLKALPFFLSEVPFHLGRVFIEPGLYNSDIPGVTFAFEKIYYEVFCYQIICFFICFSALEIWPSTVLEETDRV